MYSVRVPILALSPFSYGFLGQVGNDHPFAPIYPHSSAATAEIPLRRTDYATARRLLAQAGYPHGLTVTLTTENYLEIPQYAQVVQQQLKPAGINVRLRIEDQFVYYGAGANQPWLTVPMGLVDWAARATASLTIAPAYLCGSMWNAPHWCNSEFNRLMAAYDRELDQARRRQLAVRAAKLFHDEVPAVIRYWLDELRAVRNNVHGLANGPASFLDQSTIWRSS
jgi:peptide/nickel transport system substrate-binding protein